MFNLIQLLCLRCKILELIKLKYRPYANRPQRTLNGSSVQHLEH